MRLSDIQIRHTRRDVHNVTSSLVCLSMIRSYYCCLISVDSDQDTGGGDAVQVQPGVVECSSCRRLIHILLFPAARFVKAIHTLNALLFLLYLFTVVINGFL